MIKIQRFLTSLLVVPGLLAFSLACAGPMTGLSSVNQKSQLAPDAEKSFTLFWATWCKDCKKKITSTLPELPKKHNVDVTLVNMDKDMDRVQDYLTKNDVILPVYQDKERKWIKELKVFSVPHWAVHQKQEDGSWALVDAAPAFEAKRINKALGAELL